jgi:transcriptional/translational regulatory protein YebC/TACO1
MFERRGQILIDATHCEEDAALEVALEAGAENMEVEEDVFVIITNPSGFHQVEEALRASGLPVESAELAMVASSPLRVEGKDAERALRLLGELEDHDDVLRVYSNVDVDDAEWAAVADGP